VRWKQPGERFLARAFRPVPYRSSQAPGEAVRRANLGWRLGELTKQDMIRVEQSILVFLGIAD
jgi:hypothetical protein